MRRRWRAKCEKFSALAIGRRRRRLAVDRMAHYADALLPPPRSVTIGPIGRLGPPTGMKMDKLKSRTIGRKAQVGARQCEPVNFVSAVRPNQRVPHEPPPPPPTLESRIESRNSLQALDIALASRAGRLESSASAPLCADNACRRRRGDAGQPTRQSGELVVAWRRANESWAYFARELAHFARAVRRELRDEQL